MIAEVETLTCRDCGLTAPAAEAFYRRKNTANGWSKQCRGCVKSQTQRWYESNRDHRLATQRAYKNRLKQDKAQ